jgi:outer membrane receptor protein involved in Fe transport
VGATYKVTDKWTLGANLVAASSVYLVGDEANLTAPLPPYATLDLTTRYRPWPNVEVFAWARNVTNSWYYSFDTFSPTSSVAIAQAPGGNRHTQLQPCGAGHRIRWCANHLLGSAPRHQSAWI